MGPPLPARPLGRYLGSQTAPIVVEHFLDFNCPFSAKQFKTFYEQVFPHYEQSHPGKLRFGFYHQIQPWHPQSSMYHEVAIAVHHLNPDPAVWFKFASNFFAASPDFYDDKVYHKSRHQIYEEMAVVAESVGLKKEDVLEKVTLKLDGSSNAVIGDLKLAIKFGRQMSMHVSPTVITNGIIDGSVSSSWTMEQWKEYLDPLVANA
eukprot:GFYU01004888.1.p2 GENE.GFYU01004888.1~~GFYU01004888.1.p2  ORF type:complete len:205 (-),score=62.56 GFYU01004888.1:259-873(-)